MIWVPWLKCVPVFLSCKVCPDDGMLYWGWCDQTGRDTTGSVSYNGHTASYITTAVYELSSCHSWLHLTDTAEPADPRLLRPLLDKLHFTSYQHWNSARTCSLSDTLCICVCACGLVCVCVSVTSRQKASMTQLQLFSFSAALQTAVPQTRCCGSPRGPFI